MSISNWQAIDAFGEAIAAAGLGQPDIRPDGALHRFHTLDDKVGRRSGWYLLHLDGCPAGAFGSWKSGFTVTWCAKERDHITPRERADFQALIESAKRQQRIDRARQWQLAAARAAVIWEQARPADPLHPYLRKKSIQPHGIRQQGIGLIIPVFAAGQLASVQTIYPDGTKRFLAGGRTAGGCYWIEDAVTRATPMLICEGFATGASLHEAIGARIIVAYNANNLLPVARATRRQHPKEDILIAGDDDRWTEGNPGQTKARKAALETGAKLLMPNFTGIDLSTRPTDFNDYYRLRGAARWVES
jgi:putative DNA primase/helicase